MSTGLSLVLFLQTDEFISGLTNGYGIKMVVHDRGTKPLPQDEGIFIAAATESNIGLVQVLGEFNTLDCIEQRRYTIKP